MTCEASGQYAVYEAIPLNATGVDAIVTATVERNTLVDGWVHLNLTQSTTPNGARATPSLCASQNVTSETFNITTALAERYFVAGYLEGFISHRDIYSHFWNAGVPTLIAFPAAGMGWVQAHLAWMRREAERQMSSDPYWELVANHLLLVEGIWRGYSAAAAPEESLSFFEVFALNFVFELGDVANAVTQSASERRELRRLMPRLGGCSAFVRPAVLLECANGSTTKAAVEADLFMAQTMWTDYAMMLRFVKRYDFAGDGFPSVLFSSFPATIHSGDDWYALSSGLGVQETTNSNTNASSYSLIVPESVSEFLRVVVSNGLATTGESWMRTFCRHNSGTYNNQWMVVDFQRWNGTAFAHDGTLSDGLLFVGEQMPSVCEYADVTDVLRREGYWASYNIPYFPLVYNVSGTRAQFEAYGSYFSYHQYARAKMFRRNGTQVHSLDDVKRLMRYNDWTEDPLSIVPAANATPDRNPQLAIAARGDLTPWDGYWGVLEDFLLPDAFGAIDAKVTSFRHLVAAHPPTKWRTQPPAPQQFRPSGSVISGPTSDQQPVFDWRNWSSFFDLTPHHGQPDVFDFPWITV